MESEKTQLLITSEKQKVKQQEAIAQKNQALMNARSELEITKINLEKEILQKENQLKLNKIENDMYLEREKGRADADYYKNLKELETLEKKFTDEFISFSAIDALSHNVQFHIGEDVPNFFPSELLKK